MAHPIVVTSHQRRAGAVIAADPYVTGTPSGGEAGACLRAAISLWEGRRVTDIDDHWFTLSDDAASRTVVAAYRAGLVAQRDRLQVLSIDVLSDAPWPADVQWAVDALRAKIESRQVGLLRKRSRAGITIDADPHDVETFREVVAIAPFSIGGTGISDRGEIIWSGNDTGTSFAVKLTSAEEMSVRRGIAEGGGDPDHLVPLSR